MLEVTKNTPLAALTVGQFEDLMSKFSQPREQKKGKGSNPDYAYGLSGIRDLLGVSTVTALRYKDTFLAPAVSQVGRKIITNKKMALELFKEHKTK